MATSWDAHGYATSLRRDDERLLRSAQRGLRAPIVSCPGWTMADLVFHVGQVHGFWGQIVAGQLTDVREAVPVERPPDDALLAWFGETCDRVADVLEHADPRDDVWTWSAQKDVAFVQRRMAHEAAVHTWDAVGALGTPEAIDADLAVDGIDEYIDLFMPAFVRQPVDPGPYSVSLQPSDHAARWWLEVRHGELSTSRASLVADVSVCGTASDLLLLLWGRAEPGLLDVEGEPTALERLLARTAIN